MESAFKLAAFKNSEKIQKLLPIITQKNVVKKIPRPEDLRYSKKNDITDYDELLIARSMKGFERKTRKKDMRRVKKQEVDLMPLRNSSICFKPALNSTLFRKKIKKFNSDPVKLSFTFKKTTPEPKKSRQKPCFSKGRPAVYPTEQEEPILVFFEEKNDKPKLNIFLPDAIINKPSKPIVFNKKKDLYKFIQEDAEF